MVRRPPARYRRVVHARVRRLLSDRSFQLVLDGTVAAGVLVASLIEIVAGRAEWAGPVAVQVPLAVVCAGSLLFRRTHPVAVAAIVTLGTVATSLLAAPVQGPFELFVAFIIAFYSVGVYADARAGVAVLIATSVVTVAGLALAMARVDGVDAGDWLPGLVWASGAFLVGRLIRSATRRTAELERLATELAAERDARAQEAVTVERARIARELHDVIAHNVSVMGVQATAAGRILEDGQPEVRDALCTIESIGRQTIDEMRRMLGVLRREDDGLALSPQPGLDDLEALAAQVRAAGLVVDLRVEGTPRALPTGLDLSAYRIVQEAITNALKHAGGAKVSVTIRYLPDAVELEVLDDGGGAGGGDAGHGLVGMRERVAMFGGRLEAGVHAAGGWRIAARLPLGAP